VAALEAKALAVLRKAVAVGEPLVGVYLETERLLVVKVKDGRCVPDEFDAETVERDEARFAEIPVVTTSDEYLWMRDFVDERGEKRIAALLDGRAGANARFLKRLGKQAPDVLAEWESFRTRCIHELVDDWLGELGITSE